VKAIAFNLINLGMLPHQKVLLTSFQTWLPHHTSNAADDLLIELAKHPGSLPYSLTFLRQLPVDIPQASDRVLAEINTLQPDVIICCGMAEKREKLTIESNATSENEVLKTSVNLEHLILDLTATEISYDAGKFVCEGLYYSVLEYLRDRHLNSRCIFLHVPILTATNLATILADTQLILQKITTSQFLQT
jgi:pyroglutamyl-peptidase